MCRFLLSVAAMLLAGCQPAADTHQSLKASAESGSWQPQWGENHYTTFLRPGSAQRDEDGSGCTFNFLFVDPVAELYFIGSAAHCHGEEIGADGTGNRVSSVRPDEDRGEIGTVVFDSDSAELQQAYGVESQVDFALILLDPGVNLSAHPEVQEIGGPAGYLDCAETMIGDLVQFHGYGMFFADRRATRGRLGPLVSCDGRDYAAEAPAIFGDSGGPVLHMASGNAMGIVSRLGAGTVPPSWLTGATLPYIFRELDKAGFGNIALATADGGYVGPPN